MLRNRQLFRKLVMLTFSSLGFLIPPCASAQNTYQAVVGDPGFGWGSSIEITTDCNGTYVGVPAIPSEHNWHVDPGLWPAGAAPLPPLILENGSWIPMSFASSTTSSEIGPPAEWTASLTAGGTLTITESVSGPLYSSGTPPAVIETNTSYETYVVELGTSPGSQFANFSWHREYESSSDGVCPSTTYAPDDSMTTSMPVSFGPVMPQMTLAFVNPGATSPRSYIDPTKVLDSNYPSVTGIAADGASAALIEMQSSFNTPISLALSGSGNAPGTSVGMLAPFDPSYLSNPAPNGSVDSVTVSPVSSDCGGDGQPTCIFLALLWGPPSLPITPSELQNLPLPHIMMQVTATQEQNGVSQSVQGAVLLSPPPLVLVHGIWSSMSAWSAFNNFLLQSGYLPSPLIWRTDYAVWNFDAFNDPNIQLNFAGSVLGVLSNASKAGIVANRVDVVAHSMGGLVSQYFLDNQPSSWPSLTANPVHSLIEVGTPHSGSQLASVLETDAQDGQTPLPNAFGTMDSILCAYEAITPCTLPGILASEGKIVGIGSQSLVPGNPALASLGEDDDYKAIVGVAPQSLAPPLPGSATEGALDLLTIGFDAESIYNVFYPQDYDTIVSVPSQQASAATTATINGIVHDALVASDPDETSSPAVWCQALNWLIGNSSQSPPICSNVFAATAQAQTLIHPMDSSGSTSSALPNLDLTGYTQVDTSNVTFSPASGSSMTINASTNLSATSSTKNITEILLFQMAGASADPSDASLLYSTTAPFSIAFTPTRMGSTSFVAFALFDDMTYAVTTLAYNFQPTGGALALTLLNAPQGPVPANFSTIIRTQALYSNGAVDVTASATYQSRSGRSSVFSIGPTGQITASGNGEDWLDVSYGGVSTSTEIVVGTCAYSLTPSNQLVDSTGGTMSVQVTTTSGCSWTADAGESSWLTLTNASGAGNGTITLQAPANTTGASQTAFVTIAGQQVSVTQPATACTYSLSTDAITAPASGTSGTLNVTTSCPVIASSSADWLTFVDIGSTADYTIAPNSSDAPRSATITIGDQTVSVNQAAVSPSFTLAASPSTVNISAPGDSGSTSISVTPADGFTGAITLTCSVAVSGGGSAGTMPTCSLNPSHLTITDATSANGTLNISTTAAVADNLRSTTSKWPFASVSGVGILACFCFLSIERRRWPLLLIMAAMLVAATGIMTGCGSGGSSPGGNGTLPANPGTATGSYSVTVTATSATTSSAATISLSVE